MFFVTKGGARAPNAPPLDLLQNKYQLEEEDKVEGLIWGMTE